MLYGILQFILRRKKNDESSIHFYLKKSGEYPIHFSFLTQCSQLKKQFLNRNKFLDRNLFPLLNIVTSILFFTEFCLQFF